MMWVLIIVFESLQLWALLHFIMPTMFDSHDEFNEWFSKDIESHAEKQSGIDESKRRIV
jgi:DNA helicase INO80